MYIQFKLAVVLSAAWAQSRKFNSSSPFLPPLASPFHTHSLLFDALQLVNAESELGRLPIRGPTCATRAQRLYARSLSRSSTSASLFAPSLPRSLAPSSVFRFSACPLVIMAFRTPSDARHVRCSLARSHPILAGYRH